MRTLVMLSHQIRTRVCQVSPYKTHPGTENDATSGCFHLGDALSTLSDLRYSAWKLKCINKYIKDHRKIHDNLIVSKS